ncbi:hypothetical protein, partial [Nocardia brasiliensis]|uniref:hypothetical protein n=1 Tax=Nocardia brasiliensis TaxID=37326 RepID=UPI002453E341
MVMAAAIWTGVRTVGSSHHTNRPGAQVVRALARIEAAAIDEQRRIPQLRGAGALPIATGEDLQRRREIRCGVLQIGLGVSRALRYPHPEAQRFGRCSEGRAVVSISGRSA